MSFVHYSSLEKHLDWGKHKYALEQETLCDKAMTMYATKLERGPGVLPEIVNDGASMSVEGDGSVLPIGWALQSAGVLGQIFFLLLFVFSLTCYRVFFFFSLSGILLITLLCYVLYVNFVIVYYLALIYYQFYGSISVTTFVEVGFFLGGPDHQPRLPQHLVSSFVFHRFFINFILQSL